MTTQIRQQDGITILEPSGKIVGSSASELRKAISPQIEAYDEPRVLINFEHVNQDRQFRTQCPYGSTCRRNPQERAYRGYQCR